VLEPIGVEAVALGRKREGSVPHPLEVVESLPGTVAVHSHAGVEDIVPREPGLARPVRRRRPWLGRCRLACGAPSAIEHHSHWTPHGKVGARRERKIDFEAVVLKEATNQRGSEGGFVVVGDRELAIATIDPIRGDQGTRLAIHHDEGHIDVRPAICVPGTERASEDGRLQTSIRFAELDHMVEGRVSVTRREDRRPTVGIVDQHGSTSQKDLLPAVPVRGLIRTLVSSKEIARLQCC
jgi:hypothetical protein